MRPARTVILSGLVALVILVGPMSGLPAAQAAPPGKLSATQLRATTDKYLFEITPEEFVKARETEPYNEQLDWTSDGCSWSPDKPFNYNFRKACWRHDFGHRNYKKQDRFTEANRLRIDDKFREDMYGECVKQRGPSGNVCRTTADRYYNTVRKCGSPKASDRPRYCRIAEA